jgi:hypothetical protein
MMTPLLSFSLESSVFCLVQPFCLPQLPSAFSLKGSQVNLSNSINTAASCPWWHLPVISWESQHKDTLQMLCNWAGSLMSSLAQFEVYGDFEWDVDCAWKQHVNLLHTAMYKIPSTIKFIFKRHVRNTSVFLPKRVVLACFCTFILIDISHFSLFLTPTYL